MKPTAYLTEDRKMLVFADSPNMFTESKEGLTPLVEEQQATAAADRAFIAGLKAGYSFGQTDDEKGFQETLAAYLRKY